MSKLSDTFNKVQTDLGGVGSKISSVGDSLSKSGRDMAEGITAPMVGVAAGIGVTLNAATDFDTGMRRVATMLPGITEQGFTDISNQALQLSKDFGSSTDDMTNAMYQALSSGVPQDNIFSFMQEAEKLAIGGATDVVTSTDVLTTAVNSYGEANLSAAEASDILFQGTKFGKSTVEELASTLANVVPIAASLGIGFDDVNASLATMTIQGTPTAQATTQLRSMMDELSDKNSDVAASFKYFTGQSFPEFIAAGGTMGGAIQILNGHIGEMVPNMAKVKSAEEKLNKPTSEMAKEFQKVSGKSFADFVKGGGTVTQALDMMGVSYGSSANKVSDYFSRIEAGTGAIQLATDNGNLYKQSLDGMGESAGATAEAYETMSGGAGAALDRLKSSFDVLMIKIGDAFLPLLADTLVPAMTTLINVIEKVVPVIQVIAGAFGSLPASVQLAILTFIGLVAALGPVLMVIGAVASGVGAVAGLFGAGGALATAFGFVSATILPALSTAFGIIAYTVIPILVEALGLLISPVGLIIAAIALLVVAWKNNWGNIQGVTASAVAFINNNWNKFTAELGRLPGVASAALSTLKSTILNSWNAIINDAQAWVTRQKEKYNAAIVQMTAFKAQASAKWTEIKAAILAKLNAIIMDAQAWVAKQTAKYNDAVAKLVAFKTQTVAKWTEIKAGILAKFNAIVSDMQTWISKQVAKLNDMVAKYTAFKTQVVAKWTEIKTAIKTKLDEIVTEIKNKASSIGTALNNIVNTIKNKVADFKSAGKALIQGLIDGIEDKIQGIKNAMAKVTSAADGYLTHSPAKEGPFKTLPTFDAVLYDPLMDTINKTESSVIPRLSQVVGKISNPLSNIKSPIDSSLLGGLNNVSTSVSNISNTVSNIANSTANNYGGDTLNLGGVSVSDPVNLQAIFAQFEKYTANKRRAGGYKA